jgi:precorrin-2/cobalt-factor-2 C20-methyltransferase
VAGDEAMTKSGTLYGVGVGPGDPELMTVKAWRLISTADTIAYLAANGGESTARAIAAPFIDPDTDEIVIDMPMRVEREPAQKAYNDAATRISVRLAEGENVVMLCEGDPFFYGSFMYVFERLSDKFNCVVVPGVTSINASAAAIGQPLCERNEALKILPATMDEAALERELSTTQAAAIMKVGRHIGKVRRVVNRLSLLPYAKAIEKATQVDQRIRRLEEIEEDVLPYFTTIIIRRPATP